MVFPSESFIRNWEHCFKSYIYHKMYVSIGKTLLMFVTSCYIFGYFHPLKVSILAICNLNFTLTFKSYFWEQLNSLVSKNISNRKLMESLILSLICSKISLLKLLLFKDKRFESYCFYSSNFLPSFVRLAVNFLIGNFTGVA